MCHRPRSERLDKAPWNHCSITRTSVKEEKKRSWMASTQRRKPIIGHSRTHWMRSRRRYKVSIMINIFSIKTTTRRHKTSVWSTLLAAYLIDNFFWARMGSTFSFSLILILKCVTVLPMRFFRTWFLCTWTLSCLHTWELRALFQSGDTL